MPRWVRTALKSRFVISYDQCWREQAGTFETMLQRAADYYETRVDNAIDRLIPLLEPAMMVALGGLVGGLMLAMYLPFQMGSVLG